MLYKKRAAVFVSTSILFPPKENPPHIKCLVPVCATIHTEYKTRLVLHPASSACAVGGHATFDPTTRPLSAAVVQRSGGGTNLCGNRG